MNDTDAHYELDLVVETVATPARQNVREEKDVVRDSRQKEEKGKEMQDDKVKMKGPTCVCACHVVRSLTASCVS